MNGTCAMVSNPHSQSAVKVVTQAGGEGASLYPLVVEGLDQYLPCSWRCGSGTIDIYAASASICHRRGSANSKRMSSTTATYASTAGLALAGAQQGVHSLSIFALSLAKDREALVTKLTRGVRRSAVARRRQSGRDHRKPTNAATTKAITKRSCRSVFPHDVGSTFISANIWPRSS